MYGKLFASMYEGTLYGHWQAIVTFQQMIVLCDPDGIIDMTPQAIAARTSIPLEIIQEGVKILEQPDEYSRTPGEDGKRIVRLDGHRPWGWRIVNHHVYRDLVAAEEKRKADRERIAAKRAESRNVSHGVAECRNESQRIAKVAHSDSYSDSESKIGQTPSAFDRFWKVYPKRVKRKTAEGIWNRKHLDSKVEALIADVALRLKSDRRWLEGFIPDPPTYLNGERWEDELERPKGRPDDGLPFIGDTRP